MFGMQVTKRRRRRLPARFGKSPRHANGYLWGDKNRHATHTQAHTHVHTHTHIHTYIYTHTHWRAHTHACVHTQARIHTHAYCAYTHTNTHTRVHTHTHTHTHLQTHRRTYAPTRVHARARAQKRRQVRRGYCARCRRVSLLMFRFNHSPHAPPCKCHLLRHRLIRAPTEQPPDPNPLNSPQTLTLTQ